MKSIFSLFLIFACSFSYGQSSTDVMEKLSNDVCECLKNADKNSIAHNPSTILINCTQEGKNANIDGLVKTYGSDFDSEGNLSSVLSAELIKKLEANCEAYQNMPKEGETSNAGYNSIQLALIEDLTLKACNCSETLDAMNPNQDLQNILENCMQRVVVDNMDKLSDAFGESILTDESVAYNIGIDIGNKLIQECDFFANGNENSKEVKSTAGRIVSFGTNQYDFINVQNNDGNENVFYISKDFEGRELFLTKRKELEENETIITIFYVQEKLRFESDKTNKSVFRIETVDY